MVKSKRENVRAGGAAIFQKTSNNFSMPHSINKLSERYEPSLAVSDTYGDICAADVVVDNRKMIIFAVYLSPNTAMKQTKLFMTRNLFRYSYDEFATTPIVVTGDFNIDVAKPKGYEFVEFMAKYLNLNLSSNRHPTTLGGSCIDMVFAKNLPELKCKRFITYFSYHWPIFTALSKQ